MPGKEMFNDDQKRRIAQEYKAGVLPSVICERFGCSVLTVRRVVRKQGIPLRTGGALKRRTREETDSIIARYVAGESQVSIAKSLGMCQITVSSIVRKAGVSRGYRTLRNGGRSRDSRGYLLVKLRPHQRFYDMTNCSEYVMEHRLAMARHLGRSLRKSETVHHIDGNRANNAVENLELRQGKHGKGVVMCCADCGSRNVVASTLS